MDGFRVFRGPWWPRYPGLSGPRTGSRLDGGHCGSRLNLGFQHFDLDQMNPLNDGETVLAGACAGLDQDAFFQELTHSSLDGGLSQLGVQLVCALRKPAARAIIARLIS